MSVQAEAISVDTEDRSAVRRRWIKRGAGLAAVGLMIYLIHRTLKQHSLDDIMAAIAAIPASRIALAFLCTALSYATLTLFDRMALHYVGRAKDIGYPRTALASFISLSLGHSIGFAGISSGAIRYHFYSRYGLSTEEVAKVVLFSGVTVGFGLATLAGLALLLDPSLADRVAGLDRVSARAIGAACLAAVAAYVGLSAMGLGSVKLWRWRLALPSGRLAALQVLVGTVNFAFVAGALHNMLAAVADVDYVSVATVYVLANVATLLTHVPGGLGVIENVVLNLVPDDGAIGSVVAFRVAYFFVPLFIGGVLFAAVELLRKRRKAAAA